MSRRTIGETGARGLQGRAGGASRRTRRSAPSPTWILAFVLLLIAVAPTRGTAETKSLEDCIALALELHPSLHASAAKLSQALARSRQAAAAYLPRIDAVYSANRRNTSVAARTGTTLGTASQTFNFFNTGISFSQLLFDFGQNLNALRAALAASEAAAADLATQRANVVLQVQQAYFALLASQQLVRVAEEGVRQSQRHLELAQARREVGLAPPLDVTRQRSQLANNELNLLRAHNNVRLGRETLRNALGLEEELRFDIEDVALPVLPQFDPEFLVQRAYEQRPELASLRAQQQAAREQISFLEKSYLPTVQGSGQYEWSGADYPLQSNWNVGAAVTMPLFSGGLVVAQTAEAKARLEELEAVALGLQRDIALEVRQALLRAGEAQESFRVAERAVEEAQANFTLAEGRYETGVGSVIELTDAQALLLSARGQLVQSVQNFHTSLASLERATATSLSELLKQSVRPVEVPRVP